MAVFIAGDLRFCQHGCGMVDCANACGREVTLEDVDSSGGDMTSNAEYIILDEVDRRFPCIIVYTPDPMPEEDTISFVRKMKEELDLPVLAIAESSPRSVKNFSLFIAGGCDIKWLGLRPSDVVALKMHPWCMRPMNSKDLKLAQRLLEKDAVVKQRPQWVEELKKMVETRSKVEVDALSPLGRSFLSNVYFPDKMVAQDWI
ncbi:DNA topoisomerase 6 subunit A-like [Prunus yedoensis var. nudiflora]|uniref:DNA topoisomerase 6 subunit A-like n=1 Tax=Prunus yedoensis var. nudiflora TaxID=2094558 RepID=A0A314Z661_PRUYE|nr:DNA topoisomerase 6 subunit A-like [Prunus yedoensis var. nudiflora]